jgi:hypothetical protein
MNKDPKARKNAELFWCEEHTHYNLDWSLHLRTTSGTSTATKTLKNCSQFGRKLPASAKGVFCKQLLLLKKIPFQLPLPENRH